MPDSDEGKLEFEESHRFDFSLKAILVLVALGIAFLVVIWVL
jgi:hypothetical protein